MNRDALRSALSQDGCTSAREALAELEAGAVFEVHLSQTISAQRLWSIWSWRLDVMLDTGVTPRPGLAEAIAGLQSAGTDRVRIATFTGSQRRFTVFLSEDLTRCVACW